MPGAVEDAKLKADTTLSHWPGFAVLMIIVAAYYLFLLSNGTFQLFGPELLDKAFNNMLLHMLKGEFTVDRDAISYEGFTRDGKVYAYFAIFPSVLRLFVMPFTDIAQAELARLSCLTAVVIFVALQLRMLLIVHGSLPTTARRPEFLGVMVTSIVLSGPQLYILDSALLLHEPVLWSAAMAAAFNLVIIRITYGGKSFRARDLSFLALLAGLAINTRQSIGGALSLATILLVAWAARKRYAPDWRAQQFLLKEASLASMILPPTGILGLAVVVVGVINFARWGNALTFADFHYYNNMSPNLIPILDKYGEFNVGRIWIGALQYATDIPYLLHTLPPFAEFLRTHVVWIEPPPITPVLTNPITIILAGIGLYRVWWHHQLSTRSVAILRLVLIGHASAVVLVLGYWFFLLHYRFDFAPFFTLAALIGYSSVSIAVTKASKSLQKRVSIAAIGLCFLGVVSSHYELVLHKVYSYGVPMDVRITLLRFAPFADYVREFQTPRR